ncbi:MAG TPA: DUF6292 family protein [Pseudonocardiaceae bacterium]|nr:DUF6292 family protein [Pseudonocardiaceae bacterium]
MSACRPSRAEGDPAHFDHYSAYYLTAYLGAVAGGLSRRGIVIHTAELTPGPRFLGCGITFDPPRKPADQDPSAWVARHASWDECHGWCCQLYHVATDQSVVRRYLGEPLVPAPELVVDFIAELSRVRALGALGPARPAARCHRSPQELINDLIQFTPTSTWIG